jgi:hypothetical protein
MSAGHRHACQSDWLCRRAWFKMALAHQPAVITTYDLPYVGGSSVGLRRIHVDVHAYPVTVEVGLLPVTAGTIPVTVLPPEADTPLAAALALLATSGAAQAAVMDRGAAHFLARELRGLVGAIEVVAAREASHVVPASAGASE